MLVSISHVCVISGVYLVWEGERGDLDPVYKHQSKTADGETGEGRRRQGRPGLVFIDMIASVQLYRKNIPNKVLELADHRDDDRCTQATTVTTHNMRRHPPNGATPHVPHSPSFIQSPSTQYINRSVSNLSPSPSLPTRGVEAVHDGKGEVVRHGPQSTEPQHDLHDADHEGELQCC